MVRNVLIAIAFITFPSCNGQKEEQTGKNMPQTNITVNKQYDEKGNIIRYDSTYSSYYSNIEGDTALRDSIFNQFKTHFNQKYFFSNEPFFDTFFFEDSLLPYDFYKKDFFFDRYMNNMSRMDQLFHEMDSVKNSYFNKQLKANNKNNKQ